MKLFGFRGGVHPTYNKDATAYFPIEALPLPKLLYIPLQQHIGAPAEPEVTIGQRVLKGQLLAHSQGMISAPVHAPSSGRIVDVCEHTAAHPSGLPVFTIVLETDGEDRWCQSVVPFDPFILSAEEISTRVGAAGIVGLGGATFPSAIKLNLGLERKIHTLIINGSECEPYLTCDDRLMQERPAEVIDGIRIMAHALRANTIFVALEDNKPDAFNALNKAAFDFSDIRVVKVPTRYPMGSERQLIRILTGKETPAGRRAADIGIIMHNVATAYAVHSATRFGKNLISRIVTVSGGAILKPRNIEAPIGTLVSELLNYCGLRETPAHLLMGGPMMGFVLPESKVPVTKGCNGILALSKKESHILSASACIRCGQCVNACPVGLMPLEMAARIKRRDITSAIDYGLNDCISCGSCSYVCPSHIPLVQYFNHAKGEIRAQHDNERKNDYTKQLAEARKQRLEAIDLARQKAASARKQPKVKDGETSVN